MHHPHPGQYCIEKTTKGFIIHRGGPPLFDRPFEIEDGLRINTTQDTDILNSYKTQLVINRDSLLGACLRSHMPMVPLCTLQKLHRINGREGYVHINCTFALSKEQIQSPPLSYKEGTGHLSLDSGTSKAQSTSMLTTLRL